MGNGRRYWLKAVLALLVAWLILLVWAVASTVWAKDSFAPGCFPAVLTELGDGDTVSAFYGTSDPLIWGHASIRIYGIDTPEKPRSAKPGSTWPAKCRAEADLGIKASAHLARKLKPFMGATGDPELAKLRICAPGADKYYGRRVARLQYRTSEGWTDVADMMLRAGLAFEYYGGKKASWCDCLNHGVCPEGYKAK